MIPRVTSGRPKRAEVEATTTSQAIAISQPPASAAPLTAAIIGFARSPRTSPAKPYGSTSVIPAISPAAIAFRSAPAEKATSPLPVTTPTHSSGVGLELGDQPVHRAGHLRVDRVALLGPVEGEERNPAAPLEQDRVASHPQQPRCRAITICWISFVPSPISSTLASQ